jgi:anti-anti-sigma factor
MLAAYLNERGLTIHVSHDITVGNAAATSEALLSAWETQCCPFRVTLDLSGVRHLDSTGLGVLMQLRHRLSQSSARLVLTGLTGTPRRLLERTGIVNMFEIRDLAVPVPIG